TVFDLDLALVAPRPNRPAREADDVVPRLGVGVNLDPAAHAVHAADAAERNESIGGLRAHCVVAERAQRAQLGRGDGPFVLLQEIGHAPGLLGALAHPILDAARVDAEALLAAGRDRVEETDPLDVAPVAAAAPIRDDDVIERPLHGAAARKTNDDHSLGILR